MSYVCDTCKGDSQYLLHCWACRDYVCAPYCKTNDDFPPVCPRCWDLGVGQRERKADLLDELALDKTAWLAACKAARDTEPYDTKASSASSICSALNLIISSW